MMRWHVWGLLALALALCLPGVALADDNGNSSTSSADVFSYSNLSLDHLHEHSDFFDDTSSGSGLKFSYDFPEEVYLFAQYDKLNFVRMQGSHSLEGAGVGAHQAYSSSTSFYIDLSFLRDQLSSNLGSGADDYWRVTYGFRSQATNLLEIDGAIFTERNTLFGRRPFGERLGFGLDFSVVSLQLAAEHTADGNRTELSLVWAYR